MHSLGSKKLNGLRSYKPLGLWFTLVELIVVITILAVLATVGFLSLSGYSDDARSAVVKANVRMVYSAIATESATSGRSPRYYVDHDPAAGLSGAVTVGNTTVTLSGGQWDVPNTNYSSGNPRWDLLRLNPNKFRLSLSIYGPLSDAFAAYDSGAVSVGAVDVQSGFSMTGKKLVRSVFQVAALSPSTGAASTMGTYSTGSSADLAGLVKNPSSTSVSAAIVETAPTGSFPAKVDGLCGSASGTTVNSAPSANLCTSGTASAVSGTGPWTWSCTGSDGGSTMSCSAAKASYSVSGSFGANGAGATVSVCWVNVTADGNGAFVRSNVPAGTACNNVTATKANYACTTSVNGPSSLSSNVTNVAGNCTTTAPTITHLINDSRWWSNTAPSWHTDNRVGWTMNRPVPLLNNSTAFDDTMTWCATNCKNAWYGYAEVHTNCWNTWWSKSPWYWPYDYSYMYCDCSNTAYWTVTATSNYATPGPSDTSGWMYHPMRVQ